MTIDLIEIILYAFFVISLIISVVLHEFGHAYVSYKLGDPTPQREKRLSLNPKYHINKVGLLLLAGLLVMSALGQQGMGFHALGILFAILFAKPVLVNPSYYKHPARDTMLVSLAGPAVNFILAIIGIVMIFFIASLVGSENVPLGAELTKNFLYTFCLLNLTLGTFNLIPVPPLDGFSLLAYFFPQLMFSFRQYNQGGILQLLFIVLLLGPGSQLVSLYINGVSIKFFDILYGGLSQIFW